MKGKNIILAGGSAVIGAIVLKTTFDFGAKMGIACVLSGLSSEDISKIIPQEKGGWERDISKLIEIKKRRL